MKRIKQQMEDAGAAKAYWRRELGWWRSMGMVDQFFFVVWVGLLLCGVGLFAVGVALGMWFA